MYDTMTSVVVKKNLTKDDIVTAMIYSVADLLLLCWVYMVRGKLVEVPIGNSNLN